MQKKTTHNYLRDTSPHEIELNNVMFQNGRIDCS